MNSPLTANTLSAATVLPNASPGTAANKAATDAQPGNAFGELLARQIGDLTAATTNPLAPALAADVQAPDGKGVAADKARKEKELPGQNPPGDPAATLIALLQPLQEMRTPGGIELAGAAAPGKTDVRGLTGETATSLAPTYATGKDPLKTDGAVAKAGPPTSGDIAGNVVKFAEPDQTVINKVTVPSAEKVPAPLAENVAAFSAPALNPPSIAAAIPESAGFAIATPLGSPVWTDEFTQKISWMTTGNREQVAELHLNPPDLGPLDVVLKISDNQATALFTSPHSAVREAVESAMPRLRELMADNGITLGNTTVSDQAPRDGNAAAFSGQQSQQQNGSWQSQDLSPAGNPALPAAPRDPVRRHDGMVDTFA